MWNKNNILAFVHIEKAAGTSLIHILRRNFFLRHLDVRPLSTRGELTVNTKRIFTADDMKKSLRINPFLRCIAGHSVVTFGDLRERYPQVRFITVLRDPVARYISQYKYWVQVLDHTLSFEEFLDLPQTHNFQTTKIAGEADLDKARTALSNDFFAVGVVDKFDDFLQQLKHKMSPHAFDIRYVARNVGAQRVALNHPDFGAYHDAIRERNALDVALYEYALSDVIPALSSTGASTETSLENTQGADIRPGAIATTKSWVDAACRKAYYQPVTGLIRRLNKMPASGSY